MPLKIDHVTLAGADLKTLEQVFALAGLATDYGGPHSNGITHMSLLGFDDGSYIELISTLEPGQAAPWWGQHIAGNGGPCAWAVEAGDVAAEAARIAALGIPVRLPVRVLTQTGGPNTMTRQRPDGVRVEWDLAFVGDKQPGATLPFLIRDRTPREWRVRPSASVTGTDLTGVAMVVLGVHDLERAVDLFRRVYGWSAPETKDDVNFGRLAHFPGTPVSLAAPLHPNSTGWPSCSNTSPRPPRPSHQAANIAPCGTGQMQEKCLHEYAKHLMAVSHVTSRKLEREAVLPQSWLFVQAKFVSQSGYWI